MTRDTFDLFQEKERGRFGDNESESMRGNDSARSDLVDLRLMLREERPLSIAVVDPAKPGAQKWIWLPRSKIEIEFVAAGYVDVTLPAWLAKEKGLV